MAISGVPGNGTQSRALTVRDAIIDLIEKRGYQTGARLPSEAEVVKALGVGRTTVREAYRFLEQEGIVFSKKGAGRFYSATPELLRPLTRLEGVTEMAASRGLKLSNQVLSITMNDPDKKEREELGVVANEPVIRLARVRKQRGVTLVYSEDSFPRSFISDALDAVDWSGSLFELLDIYGVHVVQSVTQISAQCLPDDVAEQLGEDATTPYLLLVQQHRNETGRPVLYSRDWHRGSEITFEVTRHR
ncbi:GntR family transcriptional regulator [Propionimicrobium sp. PCR01-08-3]|uniref:GntR family transcriptional regulator n=1 Tax=Propionimicrobium sp. PCR01-08-3 TaxID=3052086 RepID=UPI00255CC7AA|nr:GntR family transcriptional regulator [Propionimicrobium sp. PCR01-08-3]WIY83488.1 GntR family transcriptional regulator [Propionimicrobium sp. PCR01-08-3]